MIAMKEARHKQIEGTVNANDIKGTRVLTNQGKEIGKVAELRLDPQELHLAGILIKRGLIEEDLFVGSEYIKGISDKGVVLKMTPYTELVGMKVFDINGKEIGKVKQVNRFDKTNGVVSIVVDRGFGKRDLLIQKESIDTVGENIILAQSTEVLTPA